MYYHKNVKQKTAEGKKVVKNLFKIIKKNPKRYIGVSKLNNSNIERTICDFIAGMTDRFAINLIKEQK